VRETHRSLGVLLVAAILLTAGLGTYGLWDPDEGRHAAIARELYSATTWLGWLVPSHNFAAYHDKPILYYWLTAAAYGLTGVGEVGARLVSVLAALLTVVAVFLWTSRLWGPRLGRRAALVLVTSAGFVCLGRYGSLDMLLTWWITVGLMAAERATAEPDRRGPLLVAAAAAGFGMLTKGLVAPLFIGAVPLVHAYLAGRRLPPMRALALALFVFVMVAGPWYVAVGLVDPAYLREFFLVHHLKRFASRGTTYHAGPWWYYAPALALIFFPWSAFLPVTLGVGARRQDPAIRYCLCWAAIVVGFFSCSHGKLATYILSVLPPLAVLTAHAFDAFESTARTRRFAGGGLVVLALVLAALAPVALVVHHVPWDDVIARNAPALVIFPLAAAVVLATWRLRGLESAAGAVGAAAAAVILVFYLHAAPTVSQVASERPLATVIAAHAEAPIVSYSVTPASLMFYLGRPIVRLNRPGLLKQMLAEQPFTWVVTSPRHVGEILKAAPLYPWTTTGKRVLYGTGPTGTLAAVEQSSPAKD